MSAPSPRQNRGQTRSAAGLSPDRQTRYELAVPANGKRRKSWVRSKAMAAKTNFRGSFTALVTPFKNGSLDEAAFRSLVSWQIAEGTQGLVPVGTTGESPTVSHDEHKRVVEWRIDEARGRVPLIPASAPHSTKEDIETA